MTAHQMISGGKWILLPLLTLLTLTKPFEARDDKWEELWFDIAALQRLRGLSEHMFHQNLLPEWLTVSNAAGACSSCDLFCCRGTVHSDPMCLVDVLFWMRCQDFTATVAHLDIEIESFLDTVVDQKIQNRLLSAAKISHSYSQKLLVMADNEKSTRDRAQQEYSTDPQYSVIVSQDCLWNSSCVPETDSYTVVKVFGRVSEDGETLSGFSGSSLAELILKPSLEAVQVFSLDGNTTADFQRNFMQFFMVRCLKAVLETNQENHQVYQTMNGPDYVHGYQTPQRPVDHSTQYDHQQILILENDPTVKAAATFLCDKHPSVSSVYILDENQRPKLIHGDAVPLTEESRLVLVGHGTRGDAGETRLAGYGAEEVSKIVKETFRVGDQIKTTSVVACDVGSDKVFAETLLKELHETASIKTELHLRNTVVQVRHTGEKITQEISKEGVRWRHKDDSKKVVATIDQNGKVNIRTEPASKGEAVFTDERNFLMNEFVSDRFKVYRDEWPSEPQPFLDQRIYETFDPNACQELEALSWGLFHDEQPTPRKVEINNEDQYVIRKYTGNDKEVKWTNNEQEMRDVLSDCYEVKSGEDVRNLIRHYAKAGEEKITYVMVKDWIHAVDPKSLYVYLYGKKLDNNQRDSKQKQEEIKTCVAEQVDNEKYPDMRRHIVDRNNKRKSKEGFVNNMRDILRGERTTNLGLSPEAWCTTYFTASVICESARNFRTFPLTLMALDMVDHSNNNIQEQGLRFFFEDHPMARGWSWIDTARRGYFGSATPEGSAKLYRLQGEDYNSGLRQLTHDLEKVVTREVQQYKSWSQGQENNLSEILEIAEKYQIVKNSDRQSIINDYNYYKQRVRELPTSGVLGGHNDGHITAKDLISASALENSFKLDSHFSRLKALFTNQISTELKAKYGEHLARLHIQEDSARMEDGQFICHLVSEEAKAEPVEFKVNLSPESQSYNEKMLKGIDTAVHDLESHSSTSSHEVHKYVERTGTAMGALGLLLGMKGAYKAFDQGDIEDGVTGTLQTVHGVAAMTTAVIARRALSTETSIATAASEVMKHPAMKGTMAVIPVAGIGFGVYNVREDLKRGDSLGLIDAAIDIDMIALDVLELAQPELAAFIAPINVALSVVRMAIDDVYMSIENELSLPKNAGVLQKVLAGLCGFGKGLLHFAIHAASLFYDWGYEEIEEGRRLVAQISDYHKYYKITKQQDGTNAIDFRGGDASWNGGAIHFCLADQGPSKLCMDYFVSRDESPKNSCWPIETQGSKDIILGLGESNQLEHKKVQKRVLIFIPAGFVNVLGFQNMSKSRYGTYRGNRDANRFFAIQKAQNEPMTEIMLTYHYELYGESGDDVFFLGPQRSYVEGSGGKDTYIIPENGGTTTINNYDPSKALDTLHFNVNYSQISVSKSGDDVVLTYENTHSVIIQGWFSGEVYRHMTMMSGDGVLFEISPAVVSSVRLVARGLNHVLKTQGETVDATQPPLSKVLNIFGTRYDDKITGNAEKNLIDGGGGQDHLIGGEEEDIYMVKDRRHSSVLIENNSTDSKTDLVIIEANLHEFKVTVQHDHVLLTAEPTGINVTLLRWFRSPADRHLLVVTKDLVTFKISDQKEDCRHPDPFYKCIKSLRIDFSGSESALVLDLQGDEAYESVTEVRGSNLNDVIRGDKEHNVFIPEGGNDYIQGRGGEDWYVITPGTGVKTINNHSPDLTLDILFLKEEFKHVTCACEGQSIVVLVNNSKQVVLENWFHSKSHQHLTIKTSDGITAGLEPSISSCDKPLISALIVDYRKKKTEPLTLSQRYLQKLSVNADDAFSVDHCFTYRSTYSGEDFCGFQGKVMMNFGEAVKEMYGSSGFDIMVGNRKENVLDPYTEGALMSGGEGKDTYIIKRGYGNYILIDNFAEDRRIDTVLVDMDFLHGSQVVLKSRARHLNVMIRTKGEEFGLRLLNYNNGPQHQHIEFQTSDGVHFRLKSLNSSGDVPSFDIEAFKVTLKQSELDCRLDLSLQQNLSKVHTVQGCASRSNSILGNARDNVLMGGWKDDVMEGGEGDDILIGGNGNDLLLGGIGGDTLYGEDGNDTMFGNSGQDIFIPGMGADVVDGGPGRDSVLYRGDHDTGRGVYVNLLTGQGRYADAEGDVLKDVETVIGTIYSDILVSGYESTVLKGSEGDDILVSTGGDYLVGGDGNDIYLLAFRNGSVTIDNCANDKATDVLYLRSTLRNYCHQVSPERVVLTFCGFNGNILKVVLQGWTSDDSECGHLKLAYNGEWVTVGKLPKCDPK